MKARNVTDKEICESKYRFGILEGVKNKTFYNGVEIRELFSKYALDYTAKDVETVVNQIVPVDAFHSDRERQINLNLLLQKLIRFKEYMTTHTAPSAIQLSKQLPFLDILCKILCFSNFFTYFSC